MAAIYEFADPVKLGIDAANARTPRLHPSAIDEFGKMLSDSVARGDWFQSATDAVINSAGQTVEQFLDFQIETRPHWLVPKPVIERADETWIDTTPDKQARRWRELREQYSSDSATNQALAAEGAQYGLKPGDKGPGIKPGSDDGDSKSKKRDHSNNPFHKSQWNISKQGALIKSLGLEKANEIARSVGSHVGATKPNADY